MKVKYLLFTIPFFIFSCSSNNSGSEDSENGTDSTQSETTEVAPDSELEVAETAVFFANLTEGAEVKNPIKIEMGVKGMKLEPKGPINDNAGHHHLIIDGTFVPQGQIIPTSETSIHYGGAETSGEINLTPGQHTLTLQFGDGAHASYGEGMSSTITVNVIE